MGLWLQVGILKKKDPWEQAFREAWRREERFRARHAEKRESAVDRKLEELVPDKLAETLHTAFGKAFEMVFEKGTDAILRAGRVEEKRFSYQVNACAADLKEDRKTLRAFSKAAKRAGAGNVLLSGTAGVGMGLFGVALPDVPLFTAMLLKSIYETAESYGFPCDTEAEQLYVLRLIEAALSYGEALDAHGRALDTYAQTGVWPEAVERRMQVQAAAKCLSETVLYGKFLQNVPLVGAVGGMEDAVCLSRVQQYAAIKYQKRFLIERRRND